MSSLIYTVLVVILLIAVLVWAIRSGQFKQQDRARYLPLADDAVEAASPSKRSGRRQPTVFRMTPLLAAILLAAIVVITTLLVMRP